MGTLRNLLNREDGKKVSLFRFIEECTQQTASFSAIMHELEISEFVLLRTAENLSKDIELNDLTPHFSLTISRTHKTITLKKDSDASISMLYIIYIKNSLSYNILVDILNGKFVSMTDFGEFNFVSYSAVHKKIQEVKKELANYQVRLSSKYELIGDEIKIMMFFYHLYYPRFNQLNFPFEAKYEKLTQQFIRLFENHLDHSIQETLKTKINFFLSVSLKRINMKKYLTSNARIERARYTFNHEHPLFQMVYEFLEKEYRLLKREALISESESIVAFLMGESGVRRTEYSSLEDIVEVQDNLTPLFVHEFEDQFKNKVEKAQHDLLIQELSVLHFKLYYFKKVQPVFGDLLNMEFLEETYADAFKFCVEFIGRLPDKKEYKLLTSNENFVFHQYLFLIVQIFPSKFFMETIYVCLDFSLGSYYTNIIETNLKSFNFFNIEVTSYVHEKTDLFISDYIYKNIKLPSLVWNMPPTAKDWANVGEFLVRIKNEKAEKVTQ
ncbi:helix-turn-helix domain-containing protein [Carnobacterium maltaromaticum]|uniref:helix-turn-helix domain-containing protein n=1 Tax=Carnobacterium maltaromaticum TaxID=2751 RepID=UPI00242B31A9|nr:helix-turn-helix domain-containing protein [Carnobacterium maltaromaticum]MCI1819261.1 helix-turn-helix domain-containing protein [Carnobacterium maltaromaticum]